MTKTSLNSERETLSDADREFFRHTVREFLSKHWPAGRDITASGDKAAIAALWTEMSGLGLTSLGIDASEGGVREIAIVFEELGRASCPAPMLGAVLANIALASRRETEAASTLLDALSAGRARIAGVFGAFDGDASAGHVDVEGSGATPQLTGRVAFVESCSEATHFMICTQSPLGVAIVAAGAAGVRVTETPGLAVPALSEVAFDNVPCTLFRMVDGEIEDLLGIGRLACASRAIGAAARALELAVEHAKVRRQFGLLIGQFQAVQHKLADCLISLDGARLTLEHAAEKRDRQDPQWTVFASASLAFAGPALRAAAVQIHRALGAIGYAEEHEAPRHFRRVHADFVRFGGTSRAREALAEYLLGPAN